MDFPVLSIRGDTLEFYRSDSEVRKCTEVALKKGWFNGLRILDAGGVLYTVKAARFLRKTAQKVHPGWFAAKWIEVELEMSGDRRLSLDEVRSTVSRALKGNPGFWESSGRDLSEVIRGVEEAQSIDRIWQLITPLLA